MNKSVVFFGLWSFLLVLALSLAEKYILSAWYPDKYLNGFWTVFLIIGLITFAFHTILVSVSSSRPATFINRFVAFTGMRLLIYLMIILLYVFLINTQIVTFLLTFLVGYFVFTTFEISSILNFLRKKSPKDSIINQ
jgi:hypothetical protein